MAGRIRTIKPEWLEDEKLLTVSIEARLLSVALLLIADDHGRGRAQPVRIGAAVFPGEADATATAKSALGELTRIGYVCLYSVRDQSYFAIVNWKKHQRVDKPGAPRVPAPEEADATSVPQETASRSVYFMRGQTTGLIKIGESTDPVARLTSLTKGGSEAIDLLAVLASGSRTERELHALLAADRVHGEWFRPSPAVLAELAKAGGDPAKPLATAGYDGPNRILDAFLSSSRPVRDQLATDLRSPISITDPDEDPDPPEPEPPSRPKTEPSPESSSSPEPSPVVGPSTGGIQSSTGGIQPGAGAYSTEVDPKGRLNGLDLQTATDEQLCVIALRRVHMLRSDEVTLLREARLLAAHAATKSLGKREICEHVAEAVNKLARKLPEAAHEGKPFKPSAVYAFVARVAKRLFDEEREAG